MKTTETGASGKPLELKLERITAFALLPRMPKAACEIIAVKHSVLPWEGQNTQLHL